MWIFDAPILTTGQDATLAALYVSTKMHDTLKKPREILMVSYAVRFPELAAKSKTLGGEVDMDPVVSRSLLCLRVAFRSFRQSNTIVSGFLLWNV